MIKHSVLPKIIEWNLTPEKKSLEEIREIRDEIEERINELVEEITTITPTKR